MAYLYRVRKVRTVRMRIIFMSQILNSFYADNDNQSTIKASHTQQIELIVPN